jgi:hypothetical protein
MDLQHYKESFPNFKPKDLNEVFPNLDLMGIDLMSLLLNMDPNKRISAKDALLHVKT